MAGRIKSGEGTFGNAGEYLAELLKRGVIAAPAPRNAPAFDILYRTVLAEGKEVYAHQVLAWKCCRCRLLTVRRQEEIP